MSRWKYTTRDQQTLNSSSKEHTEVNDKLLAMKLELVMWRLDGPYDDLNLVIMPNRRWGRFEQTLKDAI